MALIYHPGKNTPNQKGLLFLKSARTAGGSVKKFMIRTAQQNSLKTATPDGESLARDRQLGKGSHNAKSLKLIDSGDYDLFTVVRNPWDRFISSLAYYAANKKKYFEDIFLDKNGKLKLEKLDALKTKYGAKPKTAAKVLHPHHHLHMHLFSECCSLIEGIPSRALARANFRVLRFENLENNIVALCQELGLKTNINDMTVLNRRGYKTERTHYRKYYDAQSRQFVLDFFEKDIKKFDYSF